MENRLPLGYDSEGKRSNELVGDVDKMVVDEASCDMLTGYRALVAGAKLSFGAPANLSGPPGPVLCGDRQQSRRSGYSSHHQEQS